MEVPNPALRVTLPWQIARLDGRPAASLATDLATALGAAADDQTKSAEA